MILSPRDTAPAFAVASAYQLRPSTARRISRLRVAWFILGTAFGVAVGIGIGKLTSHVDLDIPAKVAEAPASLPVASAEAAPALIPAPVPAAMPVAPVENATAEAAAPVAAAEPEPAVPVKPALELPATLNLTMKKRETLASVLTDNGVTNEEAMLAIETMKKLFNPKRINAGQSFTLRLDRNPELKDKASITGLSIEESPLKTIDLSRAPNGKFIAREIKAPVTKGLMHAGGKIRSSLYQTAIDSGIPVKMVGEIIQAFSYDVDFQRDIQRGDKLDVVFEHTHTDKNVTTSVGNMLYASLELGEKTLTIYRHTSADGFTGYYNAKGESVRKALLRTPINGAHITSSFGMRMHPLLGYSKMHKGVDFGAPTGTPIYAAGDGVVEEAGRKGGYGNFVKIRHNKIYATGYGHASRIAKGIHPGAQVRQGQIIAYVGSTGHSTGPHLHYEIIAGTTQVNPSGVKFRTGQQLGGKEFLAFRKQVKQVEFALNAKPKKTQVASN